MWEIAALIELLHEKGPLTKQELLDKIMDLRSKNPQAATLERPPSKSIRQPR